MSVQVCLPTGEETSFHLSNNMTVEQLREQVANQTRRIPGFMCVRTDDVRLTLGGQMLENSTPLSKCSFLPSSVIHMVLRVHGG